MTAPGPRRYRVCLGYGAAYAGVFVVVALGRLLLAENIGPLSLADGAAFAIGLAFAYGAGCVFAIPLIWTLRRFRLDPRIPIVLWWTAVPVSALGSVVGGLLGPPGILLLGGAPIVAALGIAFAAQAIWTRRASSLRGSPRGG
jgi:hypothetical protein